MKKILLFITVLFIAGTISAQNNYSHRLDHLNSSDNFELVDFYYNDDNLLDYYYSANPDIGGEITEIIDSLKYDNKGNVIINDIFQLIDDVWKHTNIIEFTYDENNNRLTRTNYVDFGWGFEPQGVYTYTYDENNKLVYHEMTLGGSMFERCNYSYDGNDNLIEKLFEIVGWGTGTWENSSKAKYEYDNENNCIKTENYYWESNAWSLSNHHIFDYDDVGNCLSDETYNGTTLVDRVTYTFNYNVNIENVIMPLHPEPWYRQFDQFRNAPSSYKWETIDDNNQLIYICDYLFLYEDLGPIASNDATLKDLTIAPGVLEPLFSSEITEYEVYVDAGTSEITITAEANHEAAQIEGTGTLPYSETGTAYTVIVTAEDQITTKEYTITVFTTVGIETVELSEIKIYPNPTTDIIYFDYKENTVSSLTIFDSTGKTVLSKSYNNSQSANKEAINVNSWRSGIYLYIIKNDMETTTGKIIVQ